MDTGACYYDKLSGEQKNTLLAIFFAYPISAFAFKFSPDLWLALYPGGILREGGVFTALEHFFAIGNVVTFCLVLAVWDEKFRIFGGKLVGEILENNVVMEKFVTGFMAASSMLFMHAFGYWVNSGFLFLNHLIACIFLIGVNIFLIPGRRLRHIVEAWKWTP